MIIVTHFPGFSYVMYQLIPLAQKHNTFLSTCAVPSMADICALSDPELFLPCPVLSSLDIVSNA